MKEIFPRIFSSEKKLLIQSLVPGRTHSEEIVLKKGVEYRVWDPSHSKPAAAIAKGLKSFPVHPGSKILYLGIANGNTASFFSDIIGPEGIIYGIEISERSLRDTIFLAEKRPNIVPILANARLPGQYSWIEPVDIVYQDVAAPDQTEILVRNCSRFLKKNGFSMISLKARSIDVVRKPEEIYREELKKLESKFTILEKVRLDPFEKDHLLAVLQAKQ